MNENKCKKNYGYVENLIFYWKKEEKKIIKYSNYENRRRRKRTYKIK